MKIKSIRLILILVLLALSFFLIRGFVYSQTDPLEIPLEGNPLCIAINPNTNQAVVGGVLPSQVSVVDLSTRTVLSTIPAGRLASGVAIDKGLNLALVSSAYDHTLSIIDLDSYQILKTIPVGRAPLGVAVDEGSHRAFVANSLDNTVSVIDLQTQTLFRTITVGKNPVRVAIDPGLSLALVVNGGGNNLSIIDLQTYTVTGQIAVGRVPIAISIHPETHVAAVANSVGSSLTLIDLQTRQTSTFSVPNFPTDLAINPLDSSVLVICGIQRKLLQIDLNTHATIGSYGISLLSTGVSVNPLTNMAAVIDDQTNSLTLFQLPNPIPTITSINPDTVFRGSGVTKVTIEGSGFIKTSTVSSLAVNFIDNHHLEVELPESLFSTPGTYGVVVTNPAPNGGSSNTVNLGINNPAPSLIMLDPAETTAGTQGLILNVIGTGFFNNTIVSTNGVPRGFTLINPTRLQIQLTAGDLEVGKYLDITAFNPPPGGGQSNSLRFTVLNPVPSLLSNNPFSIIAGSPDFTLTLMGDNFVNTSVVSFNNQQYPVTFINKNQIQTTIPSIAIITPGSYSVKVINPSPGGGESSPLVFDVLNPVPSLSSINPTSIIAGSPDFTLTLSGDNFLTTSIVSFNNQQYLSTFINKNQIETTIPSSAVATAGSYLVKVINPSPGGGESSPLPFTVTPSNPNVQPQPEGSFGEQYQDLIPPDATVQSYDPKRFSLITGLVRDLSGSPISDVSINILDHSGYGTAKTDAQGQFTIPVEGGGTLTITYQKQGLITTHRKVYVPWNDIAIAETIVMLPEDTKSTTLTFDGNPNTVLTHESTLFTDDRGSRSSTLIFTGDNRAYSVDASGNVLQELTTITTRATEFVTENSMPAKLPPNSAYTYCVELSVDGAQRVKFDKPVILWVPNFLGFNVGEAVPVGYYDRDRGVWVPSENGAVVRLLDTNGDGIVDGLDINGDGQPDDLNGDGSYSDEVIGLGDPQRYPPNSTFWRVAITHFTPWDCNWPYGPPPDAIPPNPEGEPDVDQQQREEDDCQNSGSMIEVRSRIFHEDIPIPGTDMTLHYASNRVKGFQHKITVPVSGQMVPASLKRIIVKLDVAGRSFEQILNPLSNQKAEFLWDWLDHLGRALSEQAIAHVSMGFVYDAVYYSSGNIAQAFAQAGRDVTGIRARQEVISWIQSDLTIHPFIHPKLIEEVIAEGWGVSGHHTLSLMDPSTLQKGGGTMRLNSVKLINTIAGIGYPGYSGDGGPAINARFDTPYDIAMDAEGNFYIADFYNHRIRKIDTNGIITTVAGSGPVGYYGGGYSGDGGLATEAKLLKPTSVAVDGIGNLYIADRGNNRIRKVDTNGIITTVAGKGETGYSGDGGWAIQARLNGPTYVAADTSGNLYIADGMNSCIRKVDTNGIITTVAGRGYGNGGDSGDGGPATQAQLRWPSAVALDRMGNLYIADPQSSRVRKVDTSGVITTVAGTGWYGYSGDGGPATEAKLYYPSRVTLDNVGNLYIADSDNYRIRRVNTKGIITTVAGTGNRGYSLDGGPATETNLLFPFGVLVDPIGDLYIVDDDYNNRVRKLGPPTTYLKKLTEIISFEENGVGHVFTSSGQHNATIDLNTGVILYTFGYDQNKKLVSITDQFGNITTIQRNSSGVPTAIISPDGLTTTLTIDANNNLTRITYPDMSFYSFEYTPDGLMTAKIEPEGNRFEHSFNSHGRLTDVFDQEGGHWQYSKTNFANGNIQTQVHSAEGNLTTYLDHTDSTGVYTSHITDLTGAETVYTRSADKLTATKALPCGMNLTFKYGVDSQYKYEFVKEMREKSSSGLERDTLREKTYQDTNSDKIPDLITEKITLNGKLTTFVTDTLQSKKTLTLPVGRTTVTFYDPNNLLTTKLTIPGLYDTNLGYDTKGRLTSINTDIRQTTFAYDTQGNLSSITDPENRTTTYSYNAVGRMTGIHRPDSSSLSFTYDKNNNMTILTNPSTINHSFGYNKVNFNSSYQTPLSGSYSYLYNRDRRLTQINFPSGKQIKNIYDKDRIIQTQTPEGNIDFTYLCGSKVGSIARGTETITYGYDGSLFTSETLNGTLNQVLNYAYNSDFKVRQLTYAGGSVNFTYDNDGLLTGAAGFAITHNAGNGLPEVVTGGALNLSRVFNGYGELESQNFVINTLNLTSWGLTRDKTWRIISKTEVVEGINANYVYTYDPMGRLLTVTKDSTLIEEYQYDSIGRRTYEMNMLKGTSGRTFTYSDEDHLLTTGDFTYQYDADGFLTTKIQGSNITRYNYSSRGELLSVILPDGSVIEYVNDPIGRRIAKKVDGIIIEKYLWQGLTRLLSVYDGSDNLLMRFEYADARVPVAMTKGGATYYLTYDQIGSLRVVADASGNVVKRIDYDSFGTIINDTNPGFEFPLGFAGGLHDRDTGLVRFGFREYDPEVGRWTAKDPIGFSGGDVNLFGYCLNNPINYADPVGKGFWKNVGEFIKNFFMGVGDVISPIPPSVVDPEAAKGLQDLLTSNQQKYEQFGEETGEWGPNNEFYFNLGVETKDGKSYSERLKIRGQMCPTKAPPETPAEPEVTPKVEGE